MQVPCKVNHLQYETEDFETDPLLISLKNQIDLLSSTVSNTTKSRTTETIEIYNTQSKEIWKLWTEHIEQKYTLIQTNTSTHAFKHHRLYFS